MSTLIIQQQSAWNSMPIESKLLPRLKESSDNGGSTASVSSAGSDHDDMNTEPIGDGAYTTPPMTRKRKRLSMSPEVNEIPTDDVKEEIECLLRYVPKLTDIFTIVNKIGEGTFSSVYLAKVLGHRGGLNQMYALKHIIPTSHPDRTLSELSCLTRIGGQDNVIGIKLCLRERDHVILAMPYFPHQKFQEYVREMSISEVKEYMYNLVLALRRVHQFNIIHRDVKPSNFLYNRRSKRYALVDFGLAQTESPVAQRLKQGKSPLVRSSVSSKGESQANRKTRRAASAVENQTSTSSHSKKSPLKRRPSEPTPSPSPRLSELNINTFSVRTPNKPGILNEKKSPRTKMMTKKIHYTTQVLSMTKQKNATTAATKNAEKNTVRPRSSSLTRISLNSKGVCNCYGQPQVCALCMGRSYQQAPRAGTPGFRSPEVLMKYPHQTTAVDMWAAGVILLSILSGRYPFFKAQDDMTALMQIMSILGTDAMVKAAQSYGKNLIGGIKLPALNLNNMCQQLRNPQDEESIKRRRRSQSSERSMTSSQDLNRKQTTPNQSSTVEGSKQKRSSSRSVDGESFPDSAYDLLTRLLDLDPATRISADEALNHPFLAGSRS